jgi:DNA-binding SARP family transcriptional activator/pimeloyl-ACP methyl ester carboxylesterase
VLGVRVRFRVLGPVEAVDGDGRSLALPGDRQRALLAALLARAGEVVSADRLAELLWADDQPADPSAALHSQVARLRRALRPGGGDGLLQTQPPGYRVAVDRDEVDAGRFERLAAQASTAPPAEAVRLLDQALALWRGPAYAGLADSDLARVEAVRLEEARLAAVERRAEALLAAGRAGDAVLDLEPLVAAQQLREQPRATLMRALYALGRQADALAVYQDYRRRLAEELGLEPSPALQHLQTRILRHELAQQDPTAGLAPAGGRETGGLAGLRTHYLPLPGGPPVAWGVTGDRPDLVVLPGWVSSLEVLASGRDPRSSLLDRLAAEVALALYDRRGTGLSGGQVTDFGLAASVQELGAVVKAVGAPVGLLAMSQAGPVALALAAERPDLVAGLVLVGTYASGPAVFSNPQLRRLLVDSIRTHWGIGSKVLADLYRPGASDEAAGHLARVLRQSAGPEVAAGYLEAVYRADVSALLPRVNAPTLVLHYRGDRLVPFAGGQQLAAALADATLMPLDGAYHLPDATDLPRIVDAIAGFVRSLHRR